ncbi:hypothetical protein [Fodinibius halophilus]|uniref:Uncharacterized protein n=1 Tax=Fodinibius halophilus TaxID=1736908 RepID=A0A6M1T104_9BACT|nr:hypothetical protein [Fodinibius halophilus]NGP87619.1 hypothetical protein [Fodinibius halophilus]
MKRLRTHIVQFIIVLLICSGFSLSLVQSAQARHSTNAFADWLGTMAKTANGADLQQELENLRQSEDHLDKVIERASRIVSNNNEEFAFSYDKSMASQQLYEMLLIEWNQFQTGNEMSSVPVQQTVKSLIVVKTDKYPFNNSVNTYSDKHKKTLHRLGQTPVFKNYFSIALIPMVGGIAIGAP